MRIHRHGGLTKGGIENHIGGFTANARQGLQGFAGIGHFAAVLVDQDMAGFHQVFGFGVIQADGFDMRFKLIDT
ncbi:hypothetical protein HORIV_30520 [Vreelandella olivaria]|uniref:Uncharacterized protein n=1 Tax=Vreelandella olivaria TaxID=390919 RepID=A0ABM7GJ81_9GAMM|nr:hypothetical protein HORIV_30520 [Halomonas olivaria]